MSAAGFWLGSTTGLPDRISSDREGDERIAALLRKGAVGVVATDTLYGLVGSAVKPEIVERIYSIKKRSPQKPMVVLISSLADLSIFNIKPEEKLRQFLSKVWPGKVSVILPCSDKNFEYLHRGTETIAFRLPEKGSLIELIKETGPLTAPTANPEEMEPAKTIEEAKNYFGDKIDFYLDEGRVEGLPSTLIALENGKVVVKRQGAVVLE